LITQGATEMKRRTFLGMAAAGAFMATGARATSPAVDVYKEASCGCCAKWVSHLRANGFTVRVNEVSSVDAFRAQAGVPDALASCHTAFVDGYVIEGHVPAADIQKLLAERPRAKGLAVPGMPQTAPGMDAPHGSGYQVLLFQSDGGTRVYNAYPRT
jgi:hypothetical protein